MNITKRISSKDIPFAWRKMVADIPNGKSLKVSSLGGDFVYDGTPVRYNTDKSMVEVCKTAVAYEAASSTATEIKVYKGHHFVVGDTMYKGSTAKTISSVDKTNVSYDVIGLSTQIGSSVTKDETIFTDESSSAPKCIGCVLGHHAVVGGLNMEVGVGLIGTIREGVNVKLTSEMKEALKGIFFV